MRKILLIQEFGTNFGHISRLVALAKALGPHRFVFAVPQVDLATGPIRAALGPDVEIIAGHRFRSVARKRSGTPERTLADVFHGLGYAHEPALLQAARAWRDLVDQVQPDLIVGDFAPTVRLASWDRIPLVVVTGSFSTPPSDARLPVVLPRGGTLTPENVAREDELLAAAQAVRRTLGGPPLKTFSDIFQGERQFAATVPTIDPYHALRTVPSVSPFPRAEIRSGPPFVERTGPHIFCYFWSDHAAINPVLSALNGIARPSQVHIRGLDPRAVAAQCAPQVGVRTTAADFSNLLPQTRLFLHYGGSGASYAGLLAGVVQLVLPVYLEQEITAEGLIGTGSAAGLAVSADADPIALRRIIEDLLDDDGKQAAALATADLHWRTRLPDPRPTIVTACLALMEER